MRHTKLVKIPAREEERTDFISCDFCNREINSHIESTSGVDEVKIEREVGDRYPDGWDITETSVDMCGQCFEKKLLPWIASQGVEPRTEENYG